ncbi:MAG TPA: hypothetical protein PK448_06070 [Bacteroidales bacterium]|nr:hypothetical protein [Bacteroidales bacterium]
MKKKLLIILLFATNVLLWGQDTIKTYWSNEKLMSIGVVINEKEEGKWTFFHKNGVKWSEGTYRKGEKIGPWKMWYDNGAISQDYYADNGPFKSYYLSGRAESIGAFKDGKRDGEWIFYHPNGQLFKKCIYINDSINGSVTEYYDNGAKHFKGSYRLGKLHGYTY